MGKRKKSFSWLSGELIFAYKGRNDYKVVITQLSNSHPFAMPKRKRAELAIDIVKATSHLRPKRQKGFNWLGTD